MSIIMKDDIHYREFKYPKDFEDCYKLQFEIFNLVEKDAISITLLKMLSRQNIKTGFTIGAFDKSGDSEELIGFILAMGAVADSSIYGLIVGVKPLYLNKGVAVGLFSKLRDLALSNSVKHFYGIYDPLEGNLANLYFNKLGFYGINYEPDAYFLSNTRFPIDKVLIRWELTSERTNQRIIGKHISQDLFYAKRNYEVVKGKNLIDSNKILVQIPGDFIKLKSNNEKQALNWRLETRKILNEYLNNRSYQIVEFITSKINDNRESYYLLEKI